jgi:phosphatidylserine/phosphatidylglycerophosphate/cardiolipin synthase-like enzyme
MRFFIGLCCLVYFSLSSATVCFTPGHYCEGEILDLIYSSKHDIRVQSYTFTSDKIARALVNMKKKGVDVEVILDKTQFQCQHFSQRNYLLRHGVTVFEDYKPNIAHNKVIIVDGRVVETGSYNYTKSAQRYNAENVLILHDAQLAQKYLSNWQRRRAKSVRVTSNNCTNDLIHNPVPH